MRRIYRSRETDPKMVGTKRKTETEERQRRRRRSRETDRKRDI